jgi:hypothetical protein
MTDPRDTAHQWLADLLIGTSVGVEVWAEGVAVLDPAATHPYPGVAARQRVVIRLPAEEGTGT